MSLTSISNRLTPSSPIELTFGKQPIATGRKITTLIGHMTSGGGEGLPYGAYDIVNVGDSKNAKIEVDLLAGSGSQIGKMAEAFVKANSEVSGGRNFPAFRVVLLPSTELSFGLFPVTLLQTQQTLQNWLLLLNLFLVLIEIFKVSLEQL
jgi:hypothetical protein